MTGPVVEAGVYKHTSGTTACEYCGRELSNYPVSNRALHKTYRCPDRPDSSQNTIGDYA